MIYPIGEQDFAGIRERGLVYVDKTDLVYKMTHESKYYFLSRPRRFGKSLLLSTLKYYFRGHKEAFQGLAIEKLETDWKQYPVITLTFGKGEYASIEDLNDRLRSILSEFEAKYGRNEEIKGYGERFTGIIKRAHEQTGQQVVILIDEYDAPLQAALNKPELLEQYQSTLRDIYLCLKSNDEHIRFAFITGITAWGKVGVFSTLNNLYDITFSEEYATLCGITEEELHNVFHDEIKQLAKKNKISVEEAYRQLKVQYDGYHFTEEAVGVYNPFSLLWALKNRKFGNYWIQTGETQFIATLAQKVQIDVDALLLGDISMPEENMLNAKSPFDNPYIILYQAGYLTLKGRNPFTQEYLLQVPNGEVRGSLSKHLVAPTFGLSTQDAYNFINKIKTTVGKQEVPALVETLNDYIFRKENYVFKDKTDENHFQHILYLVFLCADFNVEAERNGHVGRADLVVKTPWNIYVIETKLDGSAQNALDQINERGYADAFKTDGRPIIKLGLNFSEEKRIIDDFAFEI